MHNTHEAFRYILLIGIKDPMTYLNSSLSTICKNIEYM